MSNSSQLMSLIPNGSIIRRDGDIYCLSHKIVKELIAKSLLDEDIGQFLDRIVSTIILLEARGCGKKPITDKYLKNLLKTSK